MVEKNRRMDYIDVAKGIAVLLVIVGHIYSLTDAPMDSILNIIGTLHNPIFYLASGILFYEKWRRLFAGDLNCFKVIYTKAVGLLIPFVLWSIIYVVVQLCIYRQVDFLAYFMNAVNKLWFLPILFIAFAIVAIIGKLKIKFSIVMVAGIVGIIVSTYISTMIAKVIAFTFIVYIGCFMQGLGEDVKRRLGYVSLTIWGGIVIVFFLTARISIEDNFKAGSNFLVILIACIAGSIGIMNILYIGIHSEGGQKSKRYFVIKLIGKNSLYCYILHYFVLYYLESRRELKLREFLIAGVIAVFMPLCVAHLLKGTLIEKCLFKPVMFMQRNENNDKI